MLSEPFQTNFDEFDITFKKTGNVVTMDLYAVVDHDTTTAGGDLIGTTVPIGYEPATITGFKYNTVYLTLTQVDTTTTVNGYIKITSDHKIVLFADAKAGDVAFCHASWNYSERSLS